MLPCADRDCPKAALTASPALGSTGAPGTLARKTASTMAASAGLSARRQRSRRRSRRQRTAAAKEAKATMAKLSVSRTAPRPASESAHELSEPETRARAARNVPRISRRGQWMGARLFLNFSTRCSASRIKITNQKRERNLRAKTKYGSGGRRLQRQGTNLVLCHNEEEIRGFLKERLKLSAEGDGGDAEEAAEDRAE